MDIRLEVLEEWLGSRLPGNDPSHDLDHYRTGLRLAREIGRDMPLDWGVVTSMVYLHDHLPSKKHTRSEIADLLRRSGLDESQVAKACSGLEDRSLHIHSYMKDRKAWETAAARSTAEQKVVSDALHLELVGALGMARLFAFSGVIGRRFVLGSEQKVVGTEDTLDRFKHRFLVGDVMLTSRGKELGKGRVSFTRRFVNRFLREWEGKA